MHSFVKCLFRNMPSNFYCSRFIFDRNRAKEKFAHFYYNVLNILICRSPFIVMIYTSYKILKVVQFYGRLSTYCGADRRKTAEWTKASHKFEYVRICYCQ